MTKVENSIGGRGVTNRSKRSICDKCGRPVYFNWKAGKILHLSNHEESCPVDLPFGFLS